MRAVWLASGTDASFPVRCKTYGHRDCAEKKVGRHIHSFIAAAERLEVVYYATMPEGQRTKARLSDRLYSGRTYADDGYVWVRRNEEEFMWVFSTVFLAGRTPPEAMTPIEPEKAVSLFALAVRLPGVARVQFSRDWGRDSDSGGETAREPLTETMRVLGVMDDEQWRDVQEDAAELAAKRYGIEVDPNTPIVGTSSGMNTDQWVACLQEVIAHRSKL